MADIAEPRARAHGGDADLQRPPRHLHDLARLGLHPPDTEGLARVAVPAVDDARHVHIDDIALAQFAVGWNAMADHMVHRGANGFGKTVVTKRCRAGAGTDRELVDEVVDLVRRDPWADETLDINERISRMATGRAHGVDLFGTLNANHAAKHRSLAARRQTVR